MTWSNLPDIGKLCTIGSSPIILRSIKRALASVVKLTMCYSNNTIDPEPEGAAEDLKDTIRSSQHALALSTGGSAALPAQAFRAFLTFLSGSSIDPATSCASRFASTALISALDNS